MQKHLKRTKRGFNRDAPALAFQLRAESLRSSRNIIFHRDGNIKITPCKVQRIVIQPTWDDLHNEAVRSQSGLIEQLFLFWSQWQGWHSAAGPFHWRVSRKCLDGAPQIKSRTGKMGLQRSERHAECSGRAEITRK